MTTNIDVHDLPEEKVNIIQKIVELFRRDEETKREKDEGPEKIDFLSKPMGKIKGTLSRKEMYDF